MVKIVICEDFRSYLQTSYHLATLLIFYVLFFLSQFAPFWSLYFLSISLCLFHLCQIRFLVNKKVSYVKFEWNINASGWSFANSFFTVNALQLISSFYFDLVLLHYTSKYSLLTT